jgi:GNAT superfamily N-acetyltransferase
MRPLWEDPERGVRVVRLTKKKEVETLVGLFEGIAAAEGWQPGGALRHGRDRSIYFALEVQGETAGGLQLVLPDEAGTLPCHALWPEQPAGPARRHAHVAILALAAAFRGQGHGFWPLGVELWRYCVAEGIATLFLEVTPRVLPLYRRLGWPLRIAGERRRHWGEDCYLCTLGIPEVAAALLQRAEGSPYYRPIVAQAFRVTLSPREPPPNAPETGLVTAAA